MGRDTSFGAYFWDVGVSGMLETSSIPWKSDGFDKKSNGFWSIFVHKILSKPIDFCCTLVRAGPGARGSGAERHARASWEVLRRQETRLAGADCW